MSERVSTADRLRAAEARMVAFEEFVDAVPEGERAARRTLARRSQPKGLTVARSLEFPATELRAKLETKGDKEFWHLFGHASVVDRAYEMWDFFGPYEEIVEAGAFDVTLSNDPDVAFLVNHRGLTMARTKADTLELSTDPDLYMEAWLNPLRTDVADLVHAIDDKSITEMSFAFRIADNGGWWADDFMTFKITEVDLERGDVSAVNYGANPYTDIAARQQEFMRDVARLPEGAQRVIGAEIARRFRTREDVAMRLAGITDDPPAPAGPTRSLVDVEALAASVERRSQQPVTGSGQGGRSISLVESMLAVAENR